MEARCFFIHKLGCIFRGAEDVPDSEKYAYGRDSYGCHTMWRFITGLERDSQDDAREDANGMSRRMELSHLCHNPGCINPAHLTMEPRATNQARMHCGHKTELEIERVWEIELGPDAKPRDHGVHCTKWDGCDCGMHPNCQRLPKGGSKRMDVAKVPMDEWARTTEEVDMAIGYLRAIGQNFKVVTTWPQEMNFVHSSQLV